jgi:hypothetical protein
LSELGLTEIHYGYLADAHLPYACVLIKDGVTSYSILSGGLPIFVKSCSSVEIAKFMAEVMCPY